MLVAVVGGLLAPASTVAAEWAPVGETPATGEGVFRFPQALAYAPGGGRVFVGDQFGSVVQRFSRDGTWEADIGWYADDREEGRFGVLGGLAADRDGHLFVLDSENDRVQVFSAATGTWLGAWGTRGTGGGEFRLGRNTGAGGIAVDQPAARGATVVYIADQNNHRVQAFSLEEHTASGEKVLPPGARDAGRADVVPVPQPVRIWGRFGSCWETGCAAEADREVLDHPQGIAVDPRTRNVFVADDRNHRVVEYRPDGSYVRQVGSFGCGDGQFRYPYDVGVDSREARQLYVADNNNHRIQAFDAETLTFVRSWGRFGPQPGNLEYPRALAAVADDPAGGVAVADTANNRVQAFAADGSLMAQWGIPGRGPGYVTRPGGVTIDGDGRIHIADTVASRIERLAADGSYLGQTGYISTRSGFAAPAAGDGQFNLPNAVAADPARGHVWVTDTHNDRVQELATDGSWIATHAGLGFRRPRGIAVAPDGGVLVADTGNRRIQRRDPATGAWSAIDAGGPIDRPAGVASAADGVVYVTEPRMNRVLRIADGRSEALPGTWTAPTGLAVHDTDIYVADTGASRVLRQNLLSGDRRVLGTEGRAVGRFVSPTGVAVDPAGSLLIVADTGNNRLQRLQLQGTPPAGTQRLNAEVAGPGAVHSDPAGISCGNDCRQSFSAGSTITLTATPAPGAVFAGWDGACAGSGPCRVPMLDAARVTARFAQAPAPSPPSHPPAPAPAPPTPVPPSQPPAEPPPAAPRPATIPPEDRRPPILRSLRVSPRQLTPARRGELVTHRRVRGGARLRFKLSEPATVTLIVNGLGRRARRSLTLPRGTSRMTLTGRLHNRALPPGRYRLAMHAIDSAGNRSPTARVKFRIG